MHLPVLRLRAARPRALRNAAVLLLPLALAVALAPDAVAAQTPLTVTVKGAQIYGGSPGFAGATSVSGVTVTGITCTTLTGGTPIAPTLAVGTYAVAPASCSGGTLSDPSYRIGSYKGFTFTVARAQLNVTPDNLTKTYGTANPAITYSIGGFQNGEDSSVVTGAPALATTATTTSDVGTYPIGGNAGNLRSPNYFFVVGQASLTVTPVPVTVSVTGAGVYGSAPTFTGATGVSGVTVSGITCATADGGTPIDSTLHQGGHSIDGSSCTGGVLSNGNYAVAAYTGGTYRVFAAALTIVPNTLSKTYGTVNPALTYTITGFQNGDDISVVTGKPALSTAATTASDVGSYPITGTVGTLKAPNYFFVVGQSTLTVNPAPVTVTVTGANVYGSAATFTGTTNVSGVTVSGMTCSTVDGGTAVDPTLHQGGHAIDGSSCSGGVLSNADYAVASYTGGSYRVFAAALTVVPDDQTRAYGTANPAFTYTITGLQNGDDASIVTGRPGLATTATTGSDVGTYPISGNPGNLKAPNYFFVIGSATLTVTPAPVTVSVTGAGVYGSAPIFTGATGVSGVTVSGITCATADGGTPISAALPQGAHTIDVGTCSAGVLSSSNYAIAGYSGGSYHEFAAALTVVPDNQARTYGGANPALTYTITGFQNGDDVSVVTGKPTLSTSATTGSDVGTYPITGTVGTLKAPNYFFVIGSGTLTVNPAPVSVAVTGANIYGSAPVFAATTSVSGLTVSGVTCTTVDGGTPIDAHLAQGQHAADLATCSGAVLSSANYTVSGYRGGGYHVYAAPLTVTPENKTRGYGAADPAFTYTVTGFQNGETPSILTGQPHLATTATATSAVGSYPIVAGAGNLKAPNYYFVFGTGTLTVTPAALVVTADNQSRPFGSANPTLTYTISGFAAGDTASVVSGTAATSTTATTTSDPGDYPITVGAGTLSAANYTFAFVPGTLTVTKATTTIATQSKLIKPLSATLTYGASNTPIAGATVTFVLNTSAATPLCTSTTDSAGVAKCSPGTLLGVSVTLNGYVASYAGSTDFLPASKTEK